MSARAPAVLVVVVAVVAVAWLGQGLRTSHLGAEARESGPSVDAERRLELLEAAGRFNADPAPELDRAAFLLADGRRAAGLALLEDAVEDNPGNLRAWTQLARASAAGDPRRALAAAERLRTLHGRVGARSALLGLRDERGRLLPVVTDWLVGAVEGVEVYADSVRLSGWAVASGTRTPATSILVRVGGRLVPVGFRRRAREDLVRASGLPPGSYGWSLDIPRALLEGGDPVGVFAVDSGLATELRPTPPAEQTLRRLGAGPGSRPPILRGLAGAYPLVPGWLRGRVDGVERYPDAVRYLGWAASRYARAPATSFVVRVDGRPVEAEVGAVLRPRVTRRLRLPAGRYGFTLDVPPAALRDGDRVEVFAVRGGFASRLIGPPR